MASLGPNESQPIRDLVMGAQRIQLVTHVDPDGDAIGSLLGLGWLLKGVGKEVSLTCQDAVPSALRWLPGSEQVVNSGFGSYDLVICLDCSDARRMGSAVDESLASVPLINIDHHVTNTRFGLVNWVDPGSVATAQMVLALAESLGWVVSEPVAVCLLTGLVTDTRSFRTSNVTGEAVQAALRLMEAGASLSDISRRVLDHRSLGTVRLWGEAFDALRLDDGILWTQVTKTMRQRWSLDDDGSTGLVNFLSGVREAQVAVVFTERDDDTVDVGMRAVPGFDVSQVALLLGGGGHPQASGCTLHGGLNDVMEQVLAEVRRSLAAQRRDKLPSDELLRSE